MTGERDGSRRWTTAALTDCVLAVLGELVELAPGFGPTSDLRAVGLDSLAVTQLMLAIEERTGLWIDESRLTPENLASPATLASCIHDQMTGGM